MHCDLKVALCIAGDSSDCKHKKLTLLYISSWEAALRRRRSFVLLLQLTIPRIYLFTVIIRCIPVYWYTICEKESNSLQIYKFTNCHNLYILNNSHKHQHQWYYTHCGNQRCATCTVYIEYILLVFLLSKLLTPESASCREEATRYSVSKGTNLLEKKTSLNYSQEWM